MKNIVKYCFDGGIRFEMIVILFFLWCWFVLFRILLLDKSDVGFKVEIGVFLNIEIFVVLLKVYIWYFCKIIFVLFFGCELVKVYYLMLI